MFRALRAAAPDSISQPSRKAYFMGAAARAKEAASFITIVQKHLEPLAWREVVIEYCASIRQVITFLKRQSFNLSNPLRCKRRITFHITSVLTPVHGCELL